MAITIDNYNIIIRPIITEQSVHFENTKGAYSFQVNKSANKVQIKNAVEKIYGVKVSKVRTANRKGKVRRRGRHLGSTPSWKKAVVFLEADSPRIDVF